MKKDTKDSEEIMVTGQPRYDILYQADKIYDKEKKFKKYKINPNHKIVLWTTGCHSISDEENVKNFKAVFETMQNLKNVTLIIKQHPGEGERYRKMIEKYLNDYKISAVVTPKKLDTYEQIFICDLMITKTSTTAIEAVALNKPVIILNLSGNQDIIDYINEGVALGVYKEEDLKQAIEKLLKDDTDLAMNRKSYIEKHLYKIDGKATERVADLITQMIEKSRREKDGK
jgi:UDP-N-acetylglucosamine 2-epimerase